MGKKILNITPDKTLFAKMGDSGHTHSDAVNELIDNSIDARKSDSVTIEIKLEEDFFSVRDDATGMDVSDVEKALKIAHSEKEPDKLGKYGIGMKSAMMRFGESFTLETKKEGSKNKVVVFFDKKDFEQSSDEWNILCEEVACDSDEYEKSFTELRSDNLHYPMKKTAISKINASISKKFKSFLHDDSIKITLKW